jgi:CRISPR type III-B/RAMP module-associated protein Cmr3
MKTYQFFITPLDKFYFGQEQHPIRRNYFMESNPFPQQTGILGLVRHFLLLSTDIIESKEKWDPVIGTASFNGSKQSFGKIHSIYPCFIFNKKSGNVLFPFKDLYGFNGKNKMQFASDSGIKVSYDNENVASLNILGSAQKTKMARMNLNVKEHYFNDCLINTTYSDPEPMYCHNVARESKNFYGKKIVKIDKDHGVFIKHVQPGILKNYTAISQDNSFFKMQYLKLNSDFCFSFFADIDEDLDCSKQQFMTFGGEASPFNVSISVADDKLMNGLFKSNHSGNILHFLSDVIINREEFGLIDQFIGGTQYFRWMRTDAKNNLKLLYKVKDTIEKKNEVFAQRMLLIRKGSIAFLSNSKIESFINFINAEKYANYRKIGYNYVKQINSI